MENRYRAQWTDSFGGIDRERVRQAWGEDLAELSGEEIGRGLDACKRRQWPPTLPEFVLLCRPQADAKTEWAEAREQMALRMRGHGGDRWSRPEVYWAAVRIGNYDLQLHGWESIRPRWENALVAAKAEPVPPWEAPAPALPKPGQQCVTREDARQRLSLLSHQVAARAAKPAGNDWALRLLRREAAGEQVEFVAKCAWRDVLGFGPDVTPANALAAIEARAVA